MSEAKTTAKKQESAKVAAPKPTSPKPATAKPTPNKSASGKSGGAVKGTTPSTRPKAVGATSVVTPGTKPKPVGLTSRPTSPTNAAKPRPLGATAAMKPVATLKPAPVGLTPGKSKTNQSGTVATENPKRTSVEPATPTPVRPNANLPKETAGSLKILSTALGNNSYANYLTRQANGNQLTPQEFKTLASIAANAKMQGKNPQQIAKLLGRAQTGMNNAHASQEIRNIYGQALVNSGKQLPGAVASFAKGVYDSGKDTVVGLGQLAAGAGKGAVKLLKGGVVGAYNLTIGQLTNPKAAQATMNSLKGKAVTTYNNISSAANWVGGTAGNALAATYDPKAKARLSQQLKNGLNNGKVIFNAVTAGYQSEMKKGNYAGAVGRVFGDATTTLLTGGYGAAAKAGSLAKIGQVVSRVPGGVKAMETAGKISQVTKGVVASGLKQGLTQGSQAVNAVRRGTSIRLPGIGGNPEANAVTQAISKVNTKTVLTGTSAKTASKVNAVKPGAIIPGKAKLNTLVPGVSSTVKPVLKAAPLKGPLASTARSTVPQASSVVRTVGGKAATTQQARAALKAMAGTTPANVVKPAVAKRLLNTLQQIPGGRQAVNATQKAAQTMRQTTTALKQAGATIKNKAPALVAGTASWAKENARNVSQSLKQLGQGLTRPNRLAFATASEARLPHAAVPRSLSEHIQQMSSSNARQASAVRVLGSRSPVHPLEIEIKAASDSAWQGLNNAQQARAKRVQAQLIMDTISSTFQSKSLVAHVNEGKLPDIPGYFWYRGGDVLNQTQPVGRLRLVKQVGYEHLPDLKIENFGNGGIIQKGAQRLSAGRVVMERKCNEYLATLSDTEKLKHPKIDDGYDLHHLITDGNARKSPLMRTWLMNGGDIDSGMNLRPMPNKSAKNWLAEIVGHPSEGNPNPHPEWDKMIGRELEQIQKQLGFDLKKPTDKQIKALDTMVRRAMRNSNQRIHDKQLPIDVMQEVDWIDKDGNTRKRTVINSLTPFMSLPVAKGVSDLNKQEDNEDEGN